MKNKERISILKSEISRLNVANRIANERLELIEAKLGIEPPKPPCSAITDALQEMGNLMVMVERRKVKAEAPEASANNGVSDNPIKPDFIPDWKDAPEDAVCVAMEKSGEWCAFTEIPSSHSKCHWHGAKSKFIGYATNAHLLPPDYWKSTLMMRPEAVEPDYTHLLPDGYEFCFEHDAEDWVKVKMEANISTKEQADIGHIMTARSFNLHWKPYYRPIRKTNPDYLHLLPEGYEFCSEKDAEKWVKVEMKLDELPNHQNELGFITPRPLEKYKLYYRPIRKTKPDYTHLLPEGYEFCSEKDAEKWVKVRERIDVIGDQNKIGHIWAGVPIIAPKSEWKPYYRPIRKTNPDYLHLLPEGYEFCSEKDAEKWVKVENKGRISELNAGETTFCRPTSYWYDTYRPIRKIQYRVTTHEIVDAIPDPYMPDWNQAPEGTVAHAWDANGMAYWYWVGQGIGKFWHQQKPSPFPPPPDLDWKQSLRVKPSK